MANRALSRTGFESEVREAFGELVKRYQNAAIAYAYAILRNHAGEDASNALATVVGRSEAGAPRRLAHLLAATRSHWLSSSSLR